MHCRKLTLVLTVQEQPYSIFLAVSTNPVVLHYMLPKIERFSAAKILFPVQRQRESQGRICAKITELLSYFCALPTKEHLLILKALAPFTLPAQHRRLILADYIQQYNVGGGKEKTQNGKGTSFFTIRLTSLLHCLCSETVHKHRTRLFKTTSLI